VTGVLARRNPLAKLVAALVPTLALLSTVDPVTPALFLAVELAALPLFGVRWTALLKRGWPLLLSAAGVGVAAWLFGTGTSADSAGLGLRILAVAVPSILVFATTDPTDLADALVQNARLPARFAIGSLAAFRLVPLLGEEWRLLTLARRARGLDAGHNPLAYLRLFASRTFALLVGAIRRGTRLATAMDARGFAVGVPRTFAREQRMRPADLALVGAGLLIGVGLPALTIALGVFRPAFH
jgi:energy-coupling factor transport system permease protein